MYMDIYRYSDIVNEVCEERDCWNNNSVYDKSYAVILPNKRMCEQMTRSVRDLIRDTRKFQSIVYEAGYLNYVLCYSGYDDNACGYRHCIRINFYSAYSVAKNNHYYGRVSKLFVLDDMYDDVVSYAKSHSRDILTTQWSTVDVRWFVNAIYKHCRDRPSTKNIDSVELDEFFKMFPVAE